MAPLQRAICHECNTSVPIRVGGELREHRATPRAPDWCPASGQMARVDEAAEVEADPLAPQTLQAHPACAAFPMLGAVALNELAHDIDTNGLIEPIVMYRGQILDGRNRLAACELADVEPVFREWEGDESEIIPWIISKNIHRRHLDTSQRALIAARLATLDQGRPETGKFAGIPTQAEAAALVNVSERSVRTARTVLEEGSPELVAQVERGEVSVSKAAAEVRPKPPDPPTAFQAGLDEIDRQVDAAPETAPPAIPRCGAPHPVSPERCDRPAGHPGSHGYEGPYCPITWTTDEQVPAGLVPPARVPPSVDDIDDSDADLDDPFGELGDVEEDTDTDTDTPGPEVPLEDEATPVSERPGYDGDSWSTPDEHIEAAIEVMGRIDLDPATNPTAQARIQALRFYTKADDGLTKPWSGRVWLNPPYSRGLVTAFVEKLLRSYESGDVSQAILLVNNCTDTLWCQDLLARFPACFTLGRVAFLYEDEPRVNTRQGQVLFYLGAHRDRFAEVFRAFGVIVEARSV